MDVAYEEETAFATAATFDLDKQVMVGTEKFVGKAPVKYLTGFLGFREGPILLKLVKKLGERPDVFMIDGHGRCHPRRFGIACHVGVALDKPTIGVAKSFLYGNIVKDAIYDPQGEIIGRILSSSTGKKFYVSVGHRISLDTASSIVRETFEEGHPLPLRRAHLDSIILKREIG
jgi:deoxyribonuclease V